MELTLQSLSPRCHVSGREFAEGDRVLSFLVRGVIPGHLTPAEKAAAEKAGAEAIGRFDVLEAERAGFAPAGPVVCRWVQIVKARKAGADNPERALKLTAESLFLALSDPANERTVENERLLQVLAMMLERKRVLRPKGRTADKQRVVYEHAKAKTLHEVQAAELSPEFFLSIQSQLAALVGGGGAKAAEGTVATDGAEAAPSA
jgi:hypothetical protein